MTRKEKVALYDEVSAVLTDYENDRAHGCDLYDVLVKVQINWSELISSNDD